MIGTQVFAKLAAKARDYVPQRDHVRERRTLFPCSLAEVKALLESSGFDAERYRNSYPDLAAALRNDEEAIIHFCEHCDDSTRHFPLTVNPNGLAAISDSRLSIDLKARIFSALLASYCVPWS